MIRDNRVDSTLAMCFVLLAFLGLESAYSSPFFSEGEAPNEYIQTGNVQVVDSLNHRADSLFFKSPDLSLETALETLEIAKDIHYLEGESDAYVMLAKVKHLQAIYVDELEYLLKAEKIELEINEPVRLIKIWYALGLSFFYNENSEQAKVLYNKAFEKADELNNPSLIAVYHIRMGNLLMENKEYEKCTEHYLNALQIYRDIENKRGEASLLNNLGVVFYEQGKYKDALYYLEANHDLVITTNKYDRLPAANTNLAKVYIALKNYAKAKILLDRSIEVATELGITAALFEAYEALSMLNEAQGNQELAYQYYKKYHEYKDEAINKTNNEKLAALSAIYAKENARFLNTVTNKEKEILETQFKISIYSFVFITIVLIGSVLWFWNSNQKKKIVLKQKRELLEAVKKQKELGILVLQQELEFKQKELVTFTLNLSQKNKLIEDIRVAVVEVLRHTDAKSKMELTKLIKLIDHSLDVNEDWTHFRTSFEQVHQSFFSELASRFPELNANDQRLCALISLNLSLKEVGELLGISADSVKMARYRLRKKMGLNTEENLNSILFNLKNEALNNFSN
ncbi:tetratricopeptide repeat protein [bacterium]|nr:MAG: tetratricopeptide repeat protein [bacterium]